MPRSPRLALLLAVLLSAGAWANEPPQVEAGPPAALAWPAATATLLGQAQDSDGLVQVLWTQLEGPAATIQSPAAPQTQVTLSSPGLYRFRLEATDTLGAQASDETAVVAYDPAQAVSVSGSLRARSEIEVTFTDGSISSENGTPNPFRDRRLQVAFVHLRTGRLLDVPGFFAADGNAGESGASQGDRWRVRFRAPLAGRWAFVARFRAGADVATTLDPSAGAAVGFDGAGGLLDLEVEDPLAPGFLAAGTLAVTGERYFRFEATGEPFLKGGADSPENLLAYFEFDQTFDTGGVANALNGPPHGDGLHHFDVHLADFQGGPGDLWHGGQKGARLLGAIDYLASAGVNSIYFLTYNIDGGDGREVWPWTSPSVRDRYDVSKLAQWERLFDYADARGVALHVVTQERENDKALDGGALGPLRRVYLRELVARFAHHPALVWNLGEENTNNTNQQRAFADWIKALDPYDHPTTLHTFPGQLDLIYTPQLGFANLDAISMQLSPVDVHAETLKWTAASQAAGKPWVVTNDEQSPASHGVVPDANDPTHDAIRRQALWGNLMAGGGGCEWYFGYQFPHDDLDCEDFRSRQEMWRQTKVALDFFRWTLPFADMEPADALTPLAGDFVLAAPGFAYAVFLPSGQTTSLDLGASGATYTVRWFDAVAGGPLTAGSVTEVTGPGPVALGAPQAQGGPDWVAVVRRKDPIAPRIVSFTVEPDPLPSASLPGAGPRDVLLRARVVDPIGPDDVEQVTVYAFAPNGAFLAALPLVRLGPEAFALRIPKVPPLPPGLWIFAALARDGQGAIDTAFAVAQAP